MFPECSLNVPYIFPECSLNVSFQVVMIGAAIFCPTTSNMCLDAQKLATVALLVTGGLVYTFAPPAVYLEDRKTVQEKKTK
jgi:hypothetical protein